MLYVNSDEQCSLMVNSCFVVFLLTYITQVAQITFGLNYQFDLVLFLNLIIVNPVFKILKVLMQMALSVSWF